METDATRMCALLVGLPDVNVLAVDDTDPAAPLQVHVETTASRVGCEGCGTRARLKDRRRVALVDLTAFGRPAQLVWHKRRWQCPDTDCSTATFTEVDPRIAVPRAKGDRSGGPVGVRPGRPRRPVGLRGRTRSGL